MTSVVHLRPGLAESLSKVAVGECSAVVCVSDCGPAVTLVIRQI